VWHFIISGISPQSLDIIKIQPEYPMAYERTDIVMLWHMKGQIGNSAFQFIDAQQHPSSADVRPRLRTVQ
jgi:hypothetical protein